LKLNAKVLKEVGLIATIEDEVSITQSGVHALQLLETVNVPIPIESDSSVASEEVPL
jgi:hypothetical protein